MAYDQSVVTTAYTTAKKLGASEKVMLALFEAAIVESGFRNLNYGDRDSVGFLQQRPSQGWPDPMNVATATTSFVTKAMVVENRYGTAGQLAQAIQRSAFPLKYDAVRGQAAALLAETESKSGSTVDTQTVGLGGSTGNIDRMITLLTNKGFWIRYGTMMAGVALMTFALVMMVGIGRIASAVPGGGTLRTVVKAVK